MNSVPWLFCFPAIQEVGVRSFPYRGGGEVLAAALTKYVDTDLGERGPLYWDHNGARAVLYDRWKLVTEDPKRISEWCSW